MTRKVLAVAAIAVLVGALAGAYLWLRLGYDPDISVYSTGVLDVEGHALSDAKLEPAGTSPEDVPTLLVPYQQDRLIVQHFSLTHDASIDPTIARTVVSTTRGPWRSSLLFP